MSLFTASLNSGSNGNCYYVGDSETAVLIDAGISAREIQKRIRRLGLSMDAVKAVFISHEHGDHIHGAAGLSSKFNIPVFITEKTHYASGIKIKSELINSFKPYTPVHIDNLTITAFPKFHDAIDPHSFIIQNNTVNVGVFTDIGKVCEHVAHNFKKCNAVFLETNYDEIMLEKGPYADALKRRIRGGYGHLSNEQALELFESNQSDHLTHVFLSHLSRNNNLPAIPERLFLESTKNAEIIVASRTRETKLFEITGAGTPIPIKPLQIYSQGTLF